MLSLSPPASGNLADGRPLGNKPGHPHGMEGRTQPARPAGRPDAGELTLSLYCPQPADSSARSKAPPAMWLDASHGEHRIRSGTAGQASSGTRRCRVVPPRGRGALRAFLDTVTFAAAPISAPVRGATPFRYRARKCAGARGVVRWGSMVNALGFHGTCYRVTGHLRARQVLGKTPLLDEVTRASRGYESTWSF